MPRCSGCSKNALPGEAPRSLIPARAQRKRQGDPACLAAALPTQLVPAPRVDEGATQTPQSALPGTPAAATAHVQNKAGEHLPRGAVLGFALLGARPGGVSRPLPQETRRPDFLGCQARWRRGLRRAQWPPRAGPSSSANIYSFHKPMGVSTHTRGGTTAASEAAEPLPGAVGQRWGGVASEAGGLGPGRNLPP